MSTAVFTPRPDQLAEESRNGRSNYLGNLFPIFVSNKIEPFCLRRKNDMTDVKTNVLWQQTKRALPILLGASAGYAYYYFIGCASGTCPITGNAWISTAYGALLGFLVAPRKREKATQPDYHPGDK